MHRLKKTKTGKVHDTVKKKKLRQIVVTGHNNSTLLKRRKQQQTFPCYEAADHTQWCTA